MIVIDIHTIQQFISKQPTVPASVEDSLLFPHSEYSIFESIMIYDAKYNVC